MPLPSAPSASGGVVLEATGGVGDRSRVRVGVRSVVRRAALHGRRLFGV